MSERAYRQRLESDLARWEADGVIGASTAATIRGTLRPVEEGGPTVATVVAMVGGLLIGAAFLAFVAANWTAIPRPQRFGLLLAGIGCAYIIGAWADRTGRTYIADLCAAVGCIIFGASIALVGQMYHLGEDFAGGILLLSAGSLAAAVLTASRGALAVALVTACLWSGMRVFEIFGIHLPFGTIWLIAALLAVAWNSPVARHLVALAAVVWCIESGVAVEYARLVDPVFAVATGFSLLFGIGLVLASARAEPWRAFGLTLSNYGALALALILAGAVAAHGGILRSRDLPVTAMAIAAAGPALAFIAAALARRGGAALAGIAIALALGVILVLIRTPRTDEPWLLYALALASMLCLVVSGMVDEVRPRLVAGWIGLAALIAAVTWAVQGSLLRRAVFLAAAGLVAVALASLLGRLWPKERAR